MLDTIIIVGYLIIILAIGLIAGRGMKSLRDFALTNTSYSALVICATLSASFLGGGFSMGVAEKVFTAGIFGAVAFFGFSLKEILVSKIIAPRMGKYKNAITAGDILEEQYGTEAKIIAGILAVLFCIGVVAINVGAIGHVFNTFLGLDHLIGALIGCGIVIIYSTFGGMKAIILTDVIQFIILAIGIPLTLILGLNYVGGWEALQSSVPAEHLSLSSSSMSAVAFTSLFLTFVLGETLVPAYIQRLLIGKTTKETESGTLLAGLFSIPFFLIAGTIGLIALSINPDLEASQALPFVVNTVLPTGIKGLVIVGIISIVMSTADSFLNSGTVALIEDVIKPLKKTPLEPKHEIQIIKATSLIVGVLAVVLAMTIKSIVSLLIFAYTFWSPILLTPLVATILGLKVEKKNFFAGAICGVGGLILWKYGMTNTFEIDPILIGILFNILGFSASMLTNNSQKLHAR